MHGGDNVASSYCLRLNRNVIACNLGNSSRIVGMNLVVAIMFYGSLLGVLDSFWFWIGFLLFKGFEMGIIIGASSVIHKDKQGH